MPVTESRTLYAPWIESLGGTYGTALAGQAATQMTPQQLQGMAPTVEKQTALQQAATRLTGEGIADPTTGLASYAPYMSAAGTQLGAAGTQQGLAETGLAGIGAQYADPARQAAVQAQGTLGGVGQYIGAAGTGLGAAAGTLGAAGQELTTAGGTGALGLGTAGAELGTAGTAMGGAQQYITQAAGLTGAGAGTGAGSIAEYMSPYQQQVIDTSLAEFDRQAAQRQQAISDAAVSIGGYGGGREGVMQSEYQLGSDRNRAMIEAQLQQQGYSQAQAARQADMASRLGIGGAQQQYASGLAGLAGQRAGLAGQAGQFAGARAGLSAQEAALAQGQLGLGAAQQGLAGAQLGAGQAYLAPGQMMAGIAGQQAGAAGQRAALAQAQLGAGQALQGMQGVNIARAGSVGAVDQAYAQATEDAKREANRMAYYEPYERIGWLGQGLSGIMGGMAPQYSFTQQSNPSPLSQALGIAATGAGAYKAFQ
jgi:hypothetical protein